MHIDSHTWKAHFVECPAVFLDGVEYPRDVVEADDVEGYIVVMLRDAKGQLFADGDEVATQRLTGKVEFVGERHDGNSRRKTQKETLAWAVATWGEGARNRQERARRMLEEAIELAQAEGLHSGDVYRLSERVFSRPPGDTAQEIAGVAITLAGLAENAGIQVAEVVQKEWARLLAVPGATLQAKHAAKVAEGVAIA